MINCLLTIQGIGIHLSRAIISISREFSEMMASERIQSVIYENDWQNTLQGRIYREAHINFQLIKLVAIHTQRMIERLSPNSIWIRQESLKHILIYSVYPINFMEINFENLENLIKYITCVVILLWLPIATGLCSSIY